MITPAIAILCLFWAVVLWFSRRNRGDLHKIPGPDCSWLGALFREKTDMKKNHLNFAELRKKYGPIFKTTQAGIPAVVISDYNSIHKVLVSSGKQFGGRRTTFVLSEAMKSTGILFSDNPSPTWKLLRKISQKHLRQFGDGLTKLESVITEVGQDMFDTFEKNSGKPFDPKPTIFDTALNSIAFLITGERTYAGDLLVENMREYEHLFLASASRFAPPYFQLLNTIPWLKYFGFDQWKPYKRFCQLQTDIWDVVKHNNENNPEAKSICKVLSQHMASDGDLLTECDAQMASLSLLFAGVTTTSTSFVSLVNILAHRKHVQDQMYSECQKILEQTGHAPTLPDRPDMPYTRAVLYELLRYLSPVPHGVGHRTLQEVELEGYKIPQGTEIITSLWNLHHDESFWQDPFVFRPERFLDEAGELVPADHPHRKHLMPFGAGTRVCLGESLAMTRLFLWAVTLTSRFEVSPAPGNKVESTDPSTFNFMGVLKPDAYKVILHERQ